MEEVGGLTAIWAADGGTGSELLPLKPAVVDGLRVAGALHLEDDLGAGGGEAALVDEFVEVAIEGAHRFSWR